VRAAKIISGARDFRKYKMQICRAFVLRVFHRLLIYMNVTCARHEVVVSLINPKIVQYGAYNMAKKAAKKPAKKKVAAKKKK
jgi:ABC-type branched-subunit amino acid transport system ATPase component